MTENELARLEALARLESPSHDTWAAACARLLHYVRVLQHRLEHAVAAREDALGAYDAIRARLDALEKEPGRWYAGVMAKKTKKAEMLKRRYLVTLQVEIEAESGAGIDAAISRMKQERTTVFPMSVCDLKYGCFSVDPQGITAVVEQPKD